MLLLGAYPADTLPLPEGPGVRPQEPFAANAPVSKMKYTSTYSDSRAAEFRESNPDFEKTQSSTTYYAVIKDGSHDMEITAGSEKLLRDFLGTCTIKW